MLLILAQAQASTFHFYIHSKARKAPLSMTLPAKRRGFARRSSKRDLARPRREETSRRMRAIAADHYQRTLISLFDI